MIQTSDDFKKTEINNSEKPNSVPQNLKEKWKYSEKHDMWKDYLDFELEIGIGSGREYPLALIRSPAGEAREMMHFPYDEVVLKDLLFAMKNGLFCSEKRHCKLISQKDKTIQDFGHSLFSALITGDIRTRYEVSMERARTDGRGLRLKLRIRPSELAALPWEFMFDKRQAEYLCLSFNTSFVRYLELTQPVQPLSVKPPIRILGMIASPNDLTLLNINHEKFHVEKAIKGLQANGLVELVWLEGQTWRDLQKTMRTGVWHVFHFIGHGGFDPNTEEGLIALRDEESHAHYFTATELGRLLADHKPLRLVILNSCEGAKGSERDLFSSTASILLRRGIPAVLAMQYKISDRAAIEFSRAFYEALADGMPVDAAVAEARKSISIAMTNTMEWVTPVIYMRSPDGKIFDLKDTLEDVRSRLAVENEVDEFQRYRKIREAEIDARITQIKNDSEFKEDKGDLEIYMLWKKAKNEAKEGRS